MMPLIGFDTHERASVAEKGVTKAVSQAFAALLMPNIFN